LVDGRNVSVEIHYSDDWAALYVDGKLHSDPGDSYRIEEEAFALLGVRQVMDDAFMRGQKARDGVARTLWEVTEFASQRDADRAEAVRKRELAGKLLAEADELERAAGSGRTEP
jgi:hypothetical protein